MRYESFICLLPSDSNSSLLLFFNEDANCMIRKSDYMRILEIVFLQSTFQVVRIYNEKTGSVSKILICKVKPKNDKIGKGQEDETMESIC